MRRRSLRPGRAGAVPFLLLAASLTASFLTIAAGAPPHRGLSRGDAADVTRLALQGRADDVRAWFEEHPESCVNQRRLVGVAENGGLNGGLSDKLAQRFWSRTFKDGTRQVQVASGEMHRYKLLRSIKSGSYGQVYLAFDKRAGKLVAIKKIPTVFFPEKRVTSTHNPARSVWMEIELLQITRHSGDIMNLERVLMPRNKQTFVSVYQVFELMESFTPKFKAHRNLTSTEAEQLKLNLFQLLRGVHYMHTARLTHNDLRAKNTMLDGDCNLKIIDLGLGRAMRKTPDSGLHMPLFQDAGMYNRDLWLVGSTILYLIGAAGQFRLSATDVSNRQKAKTIINVLGPPTDRAIDLYGRTEKMVWKEIRKTHQQVMPLRERFPNADKRLISLIKQILALDRHPPTPRELLRHKYFEGMDQSTIEDGPRGVTARLPWKDYPLEEDESRTWLVRAANGVNSRYQRKQAKTSGDL
eukprot:jgi/Tetstr1/434718/TSEL_023772.t1